MRKVSNAEGEGTISSKVKKARSQMATFKDGALIGGIIGVIAALYFKKSLIIGGIIGVVAGGYISTQLNQNKEEEPKFNNVLKNKTQ
jgi:uncharacterized protein YcfJ